MKPKKYTINDTGKIVLGSKTIYEYPMLADNLSIAKMAVKGRHPKKNNKYILEHKCNFVMYILKGRGVVHAGDEEFEVEVGDVVFVPANNKFAVEGDVEYITVDTPAFYQEQSEEIVIDEPERDL